MLKVVILLYVEKRFDLGIENTHLKLFKSVHSYKVYRGGIFAFDIRWNGTSCGFEMWSEIGCLVRPHYSREYESRDDCYALGAFA